MVYRIQSDMNLDSKRFGGYTVTYLSNVVDPTVSVQQLDNPAETIRKGRGGIKLLRIGEDLLACRRYMHGGMLRAITGNVFFSDKRVVAEFRMLVFLQEHGFPAVHANGFIVRNGLFTKDLYLLTLFEENTFDLLELLKTAPKKKRLRVIRNFAKLLFKMWELGVYHPDLHLQNVLVRKTGELVFLDFDRALLKQVTRKDMEKMLWRLNRFVEKKERAGELTITAGEKLLFLKTIERLSGIPFIEDMTKGLDKKRLFYKLGWLMESTFYSKREKIDG